MKTLILMLFAVSLLMAQGNLRYSAPALIPAVDSAAFNYSVTIHQFSLTNETASDVTCVFKTKQDTPRTIFSGTVYANSLYIMAFPSGYYSPGGMSWYCSSGAAVSAQIAYRQ
jgi:hypothetical protein